MPNFFDVIKDYYINSEEDIPKEYKEIIEERLKDAEEEKLPNEFIPGERGNVISQEEEIGELFKDENKLYFGHGTPGGDETVELILKIGLKVKDPEAVRGYMDTLRGLSSTTIEWGTGKEDLFDLQKDMLNKWPHKNSDNVVIISAPKDFALYRPEVRGAGDQYEAFYLGNEKEGYRLRPEFIRGIYNSNRHDFVLNENYYENLPDEEQEKIFDEMKQRFIESYAENAILAPKDNERALPLNEKELEQASIEWYKIQLEKLRRDKEEKQKAYESKENEVVFADDSVWIGLDEISDDVKISDFDETTRVIKEDVQKGKEEKENGDKYGSFEDKRIENEGWSVDDDW